ncbi:uncharacterized protein LOC122529060 [Frieseomelitta varia]|uniref:uncharacterized protein LOC122529060 n=1 Tax=Frieseomelitta varia TaxID=561572 RepID=UPI001CB6A48C|nr:uncharacterized protein LOC122529060 [Frieseomelitta varia]
MVVKHICISSLPISTGTAYIKKEKEKSKKHISNKRCNSSYYICLGALMDIIHMQIENKYSKDNYLYFIGSKYTKDLYTWLQHYKYKEIFLKSFITSVALFAIGVKLANELVAWRIF